MLDKSGINVIAYSPVGALVMENGSGKDKNTQPTEANQWIERFSVGHPELAIILGPYEIVESGKLLDHIHYSRNIYRTNSKSEELVKMK